ncbi:MAG: carbohydrate-binding domain-containing protein, partial [Bacteroidales bacterium]|nr:carbohydrate-binding domain-containing protein [Bacteroidales bacterium]
MRKFSFFACLLALAVVSCGKDEFNTVEGGSSGTIDLDNLDTNASEDNVTDVDFVRSISIVWSSSGATVSGDAKKIVKVSGACVTADNRGTGEQVEYTLSGSCSDGFFKVYSDNKQSIILNTLSLTNTKGAAINNQGKKSCFVIVNGEN